MSAPIDRTEVVISPRRMSGRPTVGASRLDVDTIVQQVWLGTPPEEFSDYYGDDITREAVLTACWYAGAYGLTDVTPGRRYGHVWHKRWGQWADANHPAMWRGEWDKVQDPPTKGSDG